MKNLTAALLVTCLLLPAGRFLDAASSVDGLWDAIVVASGTEIPFRFEIATEGSGRAGLLLRRRSQDRIDVRAPSPTAC